MFDYDTRMRDDSMRHRGPPDSTKKLPVIELFGPTIQGEGPLAGKVSHFVRFGGCGYRCNWCDSMHAVDPEQIKANRELLTTKEIYWKLYYRQKAPWVTLTGGDPVMWDLYDLLAYQNRNVNTFPFKWAVETQGELWQPWLHRADLVTVSPKPPSSGMQDKYDRHVIKEYIECLNRLSDGSTGRSTVSNLAFKFVVFDDTDLKWVIDKIATTQGIEDVPVYLSVGTPQAPGIKDLESQVLILEKYNWLAEEVLTRRELQNVTVLPQLHVLLWGTKKGV